jgi:hypothetical protein
VDDEGQFDEQVDQRDDTFVLHADEVEMPLSDVAAAHANQDVEDEPFKGFLAEVFGNDPLVLPGNFL